MNLHRTSTNTLVAPDSDKVQVISTFFAISAESVLAEGSASSPSSHRLPSLNGVARIRRRVTGSGGYGGNAQLASAADAATAAIAHERGQETIFHDNGGQLSSYSASWISNSLILLKRVPNRKSEPWGVELIKSRASNNRWISISSSRKIRELPTTP